MIEIICYFKYDQILIFALQAGTKSLNVADDIGPLIVIIG